MTSNLVSNRRRSQLFWAMNFALVAFFTINSLGTCIVAALLGKEWGEHSSTVKFLLIVVIIVNWSTMMMAYLNRAVSHLIGTANPLSTENLSISQSIAIPTK